MFLSSIVDKSDRGRATLAFQFQRSLITIGTAYSKAMPALYSRPRQPQRVEDRSFGREAGGRGHACSLTCRRSEFERDAKRPKGGREAGGLMVQSAACSVFVDVRRYVGFDIQVQLYLVTHRLEI